MADKDNMDDLDIFFAAARRETDTLSPDLTGRILQDALQVQSDLVEAAPARGAGLGLWQQLLATLGGWPAMGGLAAACAAGIWIGVAPPNFVPDPLALVSSTQSDLNLIDSYDMSALMAEDQ